MADIERLPCGVEHELRADAAIIRSWIDVANGPINREALADRLDRYANAAAELAAEIDALRTRLEDTVRDSTNKIEALREEIGRLLDSREREGDRLDWLLARLPGDVIRDLVGEMSCTSDVGEWRDRIDKAARFKPHNP